MAYGTFSKFHHTVDLFSKEETITPAGQRKHSFVYKDRIPALAQWDRGENMNTPYIANFEELNIFIPKDYLNVINYNCRIKNIKDRFGNLIDDSFFDILSIQKTMQYSGKVHHLVVLIRRVIENGD